MNKRLEIYLDAIDKVVNLDIEYTIENTGIGRYEWWGAYCFDDGNLEIVLGHIELLKDGLSDEEYDLVFGIMNDLDSEDELYDEIFQIINEELD